jgi:hypothetical protein
MKVQDIAFFVIFLLLLAKRSPRFLAATGIVCLLVSIPLFATRIFFTAERLTWYAGAFFAASAILSMAALRKVQ